MVLLETVFIIYLMVDKDYLVFSLVRPGSRTLSYGERHELVRVLHLKILVGSDGSCSIYTVLTHFRERCLCNIQNIVYRTNKYYHFYVWTFYAHQTDKIEISEERCWGNHHFYLRMLWFLCYHQHSQYAPA